MRLDRPTRLLRPLGLALCLSALPLAVTWSQAPARDTGLPGQLTAQLDAAAAESPQALMQRLSALQNAFPSVAPQLAYYAHMLQPTPQEVVPPAPPTLGFAPSTVPSAPADAIRPAILGQMPVGRTR